MGLVIVFRALCNRDPHHDTSVLRGPGLFARCTYTATTTLRRLRFASFFACCRALAPPLSSDAAFPYSASNSWSLHFLRFCSGCSEAKTCIPGQPRAYITLHHHVTERCVQSDVARLRKIVINRCVKRGFPPKAHMLMRPHHQLILTPVCSRRIMW